MASVIAGKLPNEASRARRRYPRPLHLESTGSQDNQD